MRVVLKEPEQYRFRYSEHDFGSSFTQEGGEDLQPVASLKDLTQETGNTKLQISLATTSGEKYDYIVNMHPFRIQMNLNSKPILIVNELDTLLIENYNAFLAMEDLTEAVVN